MTLGLGHRITVFFYDFNFCATSKASNQLQVDIAYAPFIERFQIFLMEVKNYDITVGRPRLALWIEVLHLYF